MEEPLEVVAERGYRLRTGSEHRQYRGGRKCSKERAAEAARIAAEQAEAARLRLLPDAVDSCSASDASGVDIGDEGRSLTLQTRGEESFSGTSFLIVACVLQELDVPDSVMNRMGNTRALDGRQDAEWDDYVASWSYHPDSGMNVIVELVG